MITLAGQNRRTGINKEQRVSYELEQDRRGKTSAVNLQAV